MSPPPFALDAPASPYAADALPQAPEGRGGWPSRVGLLLAGLLVLGTLLAHVNPAFGFLFQERGGSAKGWPWDLFHSPEEGWRFVWQSPTAWVLALGASGGLLVLAALLVPGRLRAALALASFALLAGTILPVDSSQLLASGMNVALALVAAGAIAASARPRPGGALRVLGLGTLTLGLLLALPLPPPPPMEGTMPEAVSGYASEVTRAINLYGDAFGGGRLLPDGSPAPRPPDEAWLLATQPILAWLPGFALGLLLLLGVRGRWVPTAVGLLLLFAVAGPCVWSAVERLRVEQATAGQAGTELASGRTLELLAMGGAQGLTLLLRLSLIPLGLGVADLLRARRR